METRWHKGTLVAYLDEVSLYEAAANIEMVLAPKTIFILEESPKVGHAPYTQVSPSEGICIEVRETVNPYRIPTYSADLWVDGRVYISLGGLFREGVILFVVEQWGTVVARDALRRAVGNSLWEFNCGEKRVVVQDYDAAVGTSKVIVYSLENPSGVVIIGGYDAESNTFKLELDGEFIPLPEQGRRRAMLRQGRDRFPIGVVAY